jgi:hypothetical protein
MTFADPSTGSGEKLPLTELNGSLLLFTVKSVETDIKTAFGTTDAVKADVAVLDGPHKAETFEDTLVFPKILRSALAPNVGEMVIGRLGQGSAKPGQSPPWVLAAASDEEKAIGTAYLAHREAITSPGF